VSNWQIIYKTNNPNDVEIVKAVLEDNGIHVVCVNKMDSVNLELANAAFIELHVKPDDLVKARHIITKHAL
jgi:predicted GTPase